MRNYKMYIPLLLLALLMVLSFIIVQPFLLSIFMGAFLAYLFYPLYTKIRVKVSNKTVAAFLICFFVLLLLVVPGAYFVNSLVKESYVLFLVVKQKLAVGLFQNCSNSFCESVGNFVQNSEFQYQIQEISRAATDWIINRGSNLLVSVPRIVLNLFVMFFTLFYFLKDGSRLIVKLSKYLTLPHGKYTIILSRLKEILHGVTYGYLLVGLIQGTLGAVGFYIFGISSPIFWGLIMAVLSLVPFVGAGAIWLPAMLIMLLDGIFSGSNWIIAKSILLFLYGLFIISGLDNVLRPKLMGNKAKIHPAIVMLGIFGGAVVFGPFGVIVGPLILSLAVVIFDVYGERVS
jgi:predicted PurR-regulated permease PerM